MNKNVAIKNMKYWNSVVVTLDNFIKNGHKMSSSFLLTVFARHVHVLRYVHVCPGKIKHKEHSISIQF